MSVEEEVRKPIPTIFQKELEFRYGALQLDGFEITDVRIEIIRDKPAIVLTLAKKEELQ